MNCPKCKGVLFDVTSKLAVSLGHKQVLIPLFFQSHECGKCGFRYVFRLFEYEGTEKRQFKIYIEIESDNFAFEDILSVEVAYLLGGVVGKIDRIGKTFGLQFQTGTKDPKGLKLK